MSIIAVFPGQGSQVIGMGTEIAQKFKSAQHVFDEVDSASHSAKKNRNNKSRNGRGRRRDENNEKDVSVEVSGEDISSIEAAE